MIRLIPEVTGIGLAGYRGPVISKGANPVRATRAQTRVPQRMKSYVRSSLGAIAEGLQDNGFRLISVLAPLLEWRCGVDTKSRSSGLLQNASNINVCLRTLTHV